MKWLVLVLLVNGCNSCREIEAGFESVSEISTRASALAGSPVSATIQANRGIYLDVANSPLKSSARITKHEMAQKLAKLAYAVFPQRAQLERVVVMWGIHTKPYGVSVDDTSDRESFAPGDLADQ